MPLPIVFSRRLALRRVPTTGAPTDCLLSAFGPGKGTHKGCPYRLSSLGVWPCEGHPQGVPLPIVFSRRFALRRAPTTGAPTDCLLSAFGPGKGTHKGCPYRLSSLGVLPCEGHPQGVPLPIVFSRRLALRRDEFSVPAVRFVKSGQLQVIIFVLILLHGRPASARQFGRTLSANATCQRRKICKARHGAQS